MGLAAFKQVTAIALALCAMFAHAPRAKAQTPEGDPSNAATWYRAAAAKYEEIERDRDQAKWNEVWAFEGDPDRGPSAVARGYMKRYKGVLDLTRRATRRNRCDFGRPHVPFDESLTAELMGLRRQVYLLRDDFQVRVFDHDVDGATDCISETLRIADHASQSGALMSSMVGSAFVSSANHLLQHGLDRAIVGPAQASRLVKAIDQLEGDDPMRYRQAAANECQAYVEQIRAKFSGQGGLDRFREEYHQFVHDRHPELRDAMKAMTQTELDALIAGMAVLQDRILSTVNEPNAVQAAMAMEALKQEFNEGNHGRFTGILMAGTDRLVADMQRTRKQLDEMRAALQGIADGTVDPLSLANAACWYVRAAIEMQQVDEVSRGKIAELATTPNATATPELFDLLRREDVARVLKSLDVASSIQRCDFSYNLPPSGSVSRPYHGGMMECAHLLLADATVQSQSKNVSANARRLANANRMSACVAADGTITGSLVAHRIFDLAELRSIELLTNIAWQSEDHTIIIKEVRRFSRADPFHYQPALGRMREGAKWWFAWMMNGMPNPAPQHHDPVFADRAQAAIDACDDDQLLSISVMLDALAAKYNGVAMPDRQSLAGLESVLDFAAMDAAIEQAHVLKEWGKQGVLGNVHQVRLPVIASVEDRAKQSIEDFRACVRRLEGTGADSPASAPATSRD